MSTDLDRMRSIFEQDPASDIAPDYAACLLRSGLTHDAMKVTLDGLRARPESDRLRLLLARTMFELGLRDQAAREVEALTRKYPERAFLVQLAKRLGVAPSATKKVETVAEDEFDLETISKL